MQAPGNPASRVSQVGPPTAIVSMASQASDSKNNAGTIKDKDGISRAMVKNRFYAFADAHSELLDTLDNVWDSRVRCSSNCILQCSMYTRKVSSIKPYLFVIISDTLLQ